jgi:hypothetical protein
MRSLSGRAVWVDSGLSRRSVTSQPGQLLCWREGPGSANSGPCTALLKRFVQRRYSLGDGLIPAGSFHLSLTRRTSSNGQVMQLRIQTTSGVEVKWAGHIRSDPVYYDGSPPETGQWKLSMPKIADYFCDELRAFSFGQSLDTFVLGFEIATLEQWGKFFKSTAEYTSYRPKMRLLLSVGQLNWPDVKDISAEEQFFKFSETLLDAIQRVNTMKRKPKSFDLECFSDTIAQLLKNCPVAKIVA